MIKSLIISVILILAISSLIAPEIAFAQSLSKPSVPIFTVKFVDYSFDVPTTYGIDQSTGKNVTIQAGYHVENRTIEFAIKNQPFTPNNDSNGNSIGLYYNFRAKEQNGNEWILHPFAQTGQGTWQSTYTNSEYQQSVSRIYLASNTQSTDAIISLDFFDLQHVSVGNQVDFQVQALTGHVAPINSGSLSGMGYYSFTGNSSDWSNTQTITIVNDTTNSMSASNSPTPTSAIPEFTPTILSIGLLTVTLIGSFMIKKKQSSRIRL